MFGAAVKTGADYFPAVEWFAWSVGGAASAVALITVGRRIGPTDSKNAKWFLLGCTLLISLLSGIGGLIGKEPVTAFSGFTMFIVAAAFVGMRWGPRQVVTQIEPLSEAGAELQPNSESDFKEQKVVPKEPVPENKLCPRCHHKCLPDSKECEICRYDFTIWG